MALLALDQGTFVAEFGDGFLVASEEEEGEDGQGAADVDAEHLWVNGVNGDNYYSGMGWWHNR